MSIATEAVLYVTKYDDRDVNDGFHDQLLDHEVDDEQYFDLVTQPEVAMTGTMYVANFNAVPPEKVIEFCSLLPWDSIGAEGILILNHEYPNRDGTTPIVVAHFPLNKPVEAYR